MEKNRKTTALVIAALVVSVISLGVAFAAFSTQLNISGTAKIAATNWRIYFADASGDTTPGGTVSVQAENITETGSGKSTTATLTGTDFTWAATFKAPGDKVRYHFYVVNKGDYNAKLSGINTPTITCTQGGDPETNYCSYISYTLSHNDDGTDPVSNGETLNAGASTDIYVTATLGDYTTGAHAQTTPPDADITTSAITNTLIYTQDGPAVTPQS